MQLWPQHMTPLRAGRTFESNTSVHCHIVNAIILHGFRVLEEDDFCLKIRQLVDVETGARVFTNETFTKAYAKA